MWLLLIRIVCKWILAVRDALAAAISGAVQDFTDKVVAPLGEEIVGALLHLAGVAALISVPVLLIAALIWHDRRAVR
jgi:hypothetical protein